jgi:signal transduction histidine kinase
VATLVFERNAPARVDRLADDANEATALAIERARSAAGAPINVEGRLWGVMTVGSSDEQGLPAGIEHRLAEFVELVATAIANTEARTELRALVDEQAALRRVATLVASGARMEGVLAAVAEEVCGLLPADVSMIGRYDGRNTVVGVGGWNRNGEPFEVGATFTVGGRNVTTFVVETGRPARLDSYEEASGGAADEARTLGLRSSVGAPVSVEGRLWGVVVVASTRDEAFPPGTEERLAGFAELVATAIANAEAQAALTASRARVVAAADETRRRIERDLHDGAQQRLVSLALQLRAAQAALPSGLDEVAGEIDTVAEGLTAALEELREFARGIHPAILAEGGLPLALETLALRSAVPVEVTVDANGRLPEAVEVAAYYVVSEALANAAKHARASRVAVEIEAEGDVLHVRVRDDGVGGADLAGGSGLVGLKDRVEALGGRIMLQSVPGAGTNLSVELPLEV